MDTSSKFLIEDLLSLGIDTYFGIPGGPVAALFDAMYRTDGIRLIESRHETAAFFEAIGYYKATGKIPVVVVTTGPGITNSLTGIASAKALRIPLIVICGDTVWERDNHILLQSGGPEGIDIEHTFAPHTEKILRVRDPENVSQQVVQFLDTRTGNAPFLLIYPLHINNAKISKPVLNRIRVQEKLPTIDKNLIVEIDKLLSAAIHPLVVIGYGARNHADIVTSMINRLTIPFVTTPQGKGIVSERNPFSLGHGGLGASQLIRKYVETSPDVVLALGTDLDDCAVGTTEYIGKDTKLIHIDLNERVFNRRYKTELSIVADIKDIVPLIERTSSTSYDIKKIKNSSPFDVPYFESDTSLPIAPHRVLADLQSACPIGTRFVTDIGEHMLFCLHYLTIENAKDFSIDLGLGSMGSGICQSIGMCLGDKRPTICICGDGCFQMHGMEILTAIKNKLPLILAVFNDARYNMVVRGYKYLFGIEEQPGLTDYIDFVKLAESIGIAGHLIKNPGQINSEFMTNLFSAGKPAILDIRIDKNVAIKGAGRLEALKHMGENNG